MKTIISIAALVAASISSSALAHEFKAGDLVINHPWSKATLPNQPVAGGFMVIENKGTEPDRLVGGSADFSGEVQIHEMAMDGDVMKMRQIAGGLEIPAGGSVELKPGGFHVMFMQLSEPLVEGEERQVVLEFMKAGKVEVTFNVESANPAMPAQNMDHGGHDATMKSN